MAFKNLAQRYNEQVNKLYAGAKTKFDGGKPTHGLNDDPLLVRQPGDGQLGIKTEGRGLPFVSAPRDLKRITLFTLSGRGILFLAKQQLLQTGNTFERTRLINPAFAIGNTIPFIHIRRHIRPLNNLLSKTDTSDANVGKMGYLQVGTYRDIIAKRAGQRRGGGFLGRLLSPITNTISAFTAKQNIGEQLNWDWNKTRPELGEANSQYILLTQRLNTKFNTTLPTDLSVLMQTNRTLFFNITDQAEYGINATGTAYGRYFDNIILPARVGGNENSLPMADRYINNSTPETEPMTVMENVEYNNSIFQSNVDAFYQRVNNTDGQQPFLSYFSGGQGSIRTRNDLLTPNANAQTIAADIPQGANKAGKISYVKDPANVELTPSASNVLPIYSHLPIVEVTSTTIRPSFDDPIIVSFAMGANKHIQFRAFIKDLQQTANPEYKTYQYIGRIEKFVSYVTVQREISFKLSVLAFSKDELQIVWKRINYLTGMVYPYGINRGILQPNVIRLTIGRLYVNQPGYITGLSTNFNDVSESWDIDDQVPIGATMDIKMNLIEKKTVVADRPLYGITQDTVKSGFSDTLINR